MLVPQLTERMVTFMRIRSRSRTRFVRSVAAVATGVLLGITGCAARTPTVTRSDTAISDDVRARLAADPQTEPFDITVDTQSGIVHVTGDVAKDSDRAKVERIALDAPGVSSVNNDVRYGTAPEPAAADTDGQ
jgi:osmotically-inducible protein OsmY